MIARFIQPGPEASKPQQMKMRLNEAILSLEATLFWVIALPAACLVFSAAVLWEQIEALGPRQQLIPSHRPFRSAVPP